MRDWTEEDQRELDELAKDKKWLAYLSYRCAMVLDEMKKKIEKKPKKKRA